MLLCTMPTVFLPRCPAHRNRTLIAMLQRSVPDFVCGTLPVYELRCHLAAQHCYPRFFFFHQPENFICSTVLMVVIPPFSYIISTAGPYCTALYFPLRERRIPRVAASKMCSSASYSEDGMIRSRKRFIACLVICIMFNTLVRKSVIGCIDDSISFSFQTFCQCMYRSDIFGQCCWHKGTIF